MLRQKQKSLSYQRNIANLDLILPTAIRIGQLQTGNESYGPTKLKLIDLAQMVVIGVGRAPGKHFQTAHANLWSSMEVARLWSGVV